MALGLRAKRLLGNERWWMLPLDPFIPRLVWHSKPILNEGARFSAALGYGDRTSTAVTYLGDLYLRGGLAGIVLGMFALGIVAQWLTDTVTGPVDRRRLFIYAAIFLTFTDMEADAFSFWSGFIKTFAILSIIAWFVYGPRPAPAKKRAATRPLPARS